MKKPSDFNGIIPAFYACYDDAGEVSAERSEQLAEYLIAKGVNGLYVTGSSGECIYLNTDERMKTLEAVVKAVNRRVPIIAHVACNNTRDSQKLAAHADQLGVDAIAAIPPIYFPLSEAAIGDYWNTISEAAPHTAMILYNIPQLAGVKLTPSLFAKMLDNPRVIGVKNSSMPTMDISTSCQVARKKNREVVIFNGPDEQLISGLAAGARAGIGGTYGVMPHLYSSLYKAWTEGKLTEAQALQNAALSVIELLVSGTGHLYAVAKEVLWKRKQLNLGGVRAPLPGLAREDEKLVDRICEKLTRLEQEFNL